MAAIRPDSWKPAPRSPEPANETRKLPPIFSAYYGEKDPEHDVTQDAFIDDPAHGIAAVFDGMGGEAGGDHASFLAKKTFEVMMRNLQSNATPEETREIMARTMEITNALILSEAASDKRRPRMATTATVTKLWRSPDGESKLIIGHAGDSRAYAFRSNGDLDMLTLDDGDAFHGKNVDDETRLRLQKKLSAATLPGKELTKEEQVQFDERHYLTKFLGLKNLKTQTSIVDVKPGDIILLMSDGISDNLTTEEIRKIVARSKDPHLAAFALVQAAVARSQEATNARSKPDDMTVVIFVVPEK